MELNNLEFDNDAFDDLPPGVISETRLPSAPTLRGQFESITPPSTWLSRKRIPATDVADYIESLYQFIAVQDALFCWNNHFYQSNLEYDLKYLVERLVTTRYSDTFAREVIKILCNRNQVQKTDLNKNSDIIAFKNTWYNLSTHTMVDPIDTEYITYAIPYNYTPTAECPLFQQTIKEIVPFEEDRDLLLTFLAYCLTTKIEYQKALLLHGRGGNGKSLIVELLQFILGDLSCNMLLHEIGERFNKIRLFNKLLNISDDMDHRSLESDSFVKIVVTNDSISGEWKGHDALEFKNTCKLVCTCNQIPSLEFVAQKGFYRRWIIIPFTQSFEENKNINLKQELRGEIEGIIAYLVTYLSKLDLLKKEDSDGNRKKWQLYGESAYAFYAHCEADSKTNTPCNEVFEAYCEFCKQENLEKASYVQFGRRLASLGVSKKQLADSMGAICWQYIGLKLPIVIEKVKMMKVIDQYIERPQEFEDQE